MRTGGTDISPKYDQIEERRYHIEIRLGMLICPVKRCENGFKTSEALLEHLIRHVDAGNVCPLCYGKDSTIRYHDAWNLVLHLERHITPAARDPSSHVKCQCPICYSIHGHPSNLFQHIRDVHNRTLQLLNISSDSGTINAVEKAHLENMDSRSMLFKGKFNLATISPGLMEAINAIPQALSRPQAIVSPVAIANLDAHLDMAYSAGHLHKDFLDRESRSSLIDRVEVDTVGGQFCCPLDTCQKELYKTMAALARHISKMFEPLGTECEWCRRRFASETGEPATSYPTTTLIKVRHHSEEHILRHLPPSYKCHTKECSYIGHTKPDRSMHAKARHQPDKKFNCNVRGCAVRYATQEELDIHAIEMDHEQKGRRVAKR